MDPTMLLIPIWGPGMTILISLFHNSLCVTLTLYWWWLTSNKFPFLLFLPLLVVSSARRSLALLSSLKISFKQNVDTKRSSLCYSTSLWTPKSGRTATTEWSPWSSLEECLVRAPLWPVFCWTPIRISAAVKRHVSYHAFYKWEPNGSNLKKKKCG